MQRQLALALTLALAGGLLACQDSAQPSGPHADVITSQAPDYQWVPLDLRGDGYTSIALDLNNSGQVVGWAAGPDRVSHAVRWNAAIMEDLGIGGTSSYATGINGRGQIVGVTGTASGAADAFSWDQGTTQDLGPITLNTYSAYGGGYPILSPVHLNDQGQVVGNRPEGGSFLWQDGVSQALPLDFVTAINNAGVVVGCVMRPNATGVLKRRAALWEAGALTELGTLGGDESWAVGISNNGWVVGTSRTDLRECYPGWNYFAPSIRPFRWRDGVIEDLGTIVNCFSDGFWGQYVNEQGQVAAWNPDGRAPGLWDGGTWQRVGSPAYAFAMNGQGAITGGRGNSFVAGRAFVWEDGVTRDLGTGLGTYSRGQAINQGGVVVGYTGVAPNFQTTAAMWVPVGSPVALLP